MIRVALAQLNLHVGHIAANADKVIDAARRARDELKADIVIYPELTLTGYPPEDLLLRPHLYELVNRALAKICQQVVDIDLIIGYPRRDKGKIFNSCSLIRNGKIETTYDKQHLPNYNVFDEKRYFASGDQACVINVKDIPIALSICEDIWVAGTGKQASDADAEIMFNLNASPYHQDKRDERIDALKSTVAESQMPIVYVNMVGGQDELVFDGGSIVMDANGQQCFHAPDFVEDVYLVELDQHTVRHDYPASPRIMIPEEHIYQALVLGVRDYAQKNHFKGAVLGLSGGIDSALTAAIAADALGGENVEAVLMPSRYTADMSNEDAILEAEALNIKHYSIPIAGPFNAFRESLHELIDGTPKDTTEENIQARCRGVILMAFSNKRGTLLLTTGNKSEMSVGYATLYGDMAGGFAPLKDISKLMVYRLCEWRNTLSPVIPQRVIDRPPSAELAPDQKDSDSLPPYEILDPILEAYIERDETPEQIIARGFEQAVVERIVMLVDRNEYKRRQAAPGVRITKRAFGRDRRYPITSGYREF